MASGSRPFKRTKSVAHKETHKEVTLAEFSNENYVKFFSSRKIIDGKYVCFEDFASFGIEPLLDRLGWKNIMLLKENTYPRLVKGFYANLRASYDPLEIEVTLKQRHIELNPTVIGEILDMPLEGVDIYGVKTWIFDKEPMAKVIFENDDGSLPRKINAASLPPRSRILHRLITTNILPRAGHKDEVQFIDLHLIYCILSGTKINLPLLLVRRMIDVAEGKKSAGLPYGMLLSKIFYSFNVQTADEKDVALYKPHNAFGVLTICKMGFEEVHGQWMPAGGRAVPPGAQAEEEEEIANIEAQGGQDDDEEPITLQRLYSHQQLLFEQQQKMGADIANLQAGQQEILNLLRQMHFGGGSSSQP